MVCFFCSGQFGYGTARHSTYICSLIVFASVFSCCHSHSVNKMQCLTERARPTHKGGGGLLYFIINELKRLVTASPLNDEAFYA